MRFFPAIALLASAAALAACQPAGSPDGPAPSDGTISSPAVLEGEYRLAGLNGLDPNLPYGVAVSISASQIAVPDSCVLTPWNYRFEGERLITQAVEGPTCRRAVMPHEQAMKDAFTGAEKVSRTPANGILFEGSGGSITLFSQ